MISRVDLIFNRESGHCILTIVNPKNGNFYNLPTRLIDTVEEIRSQLEAREDNKDAK